jgi:pimeloyl-ACP methyl ester carboxylesterase
VLRRCLIALGAAAALAGPASAAAAPASGTSPVPIPPVAKVGGITLQYRILGAAGRRPLLLINGSGATMDTWDPALLARLAAHRRVIVYDPRGLGGSTDRAGNRQTVAQAADDADRLLGALGIRQADVLGWSFGAFAGQELALRHPGRVRRLVLVSADWGGATAVQPTPAYRALDERATLNQASLDEIATLLFPPAARALGQAWFARLGTQPGGCCEASTPAALQQVVDAQRRWYRGPGTRARARRIAARTLIVAGGLDVDIPAVNDRRLARVIPGARLKVYPDAGHAVVIQHEAAVAALVRAHLG